MYLFLDFDGVLRRLTAEPGLFEAELLDNFEAAVRTVPAVKIVITSAWRLEKSLSELRQLFSPDMAERIVGVTPESLALTAHARYKEVYSYLQSAKFMDAPWLAIDDDPGHYPEDAPLLLTDPYQGFDTTCIQRLQEIFANSV